MMDFSQIKKAAEGYQTAMTKFLRDLIAIPGESCGEENVVKRIAQEMESVGFDKVEIDKMGNVMGYMGHGKKLICFDGHVDTVGLGEMSNWTFDPYIGFEDDEKIGGRGASDQRGGVVSAVYGAKIMKDLGLLSDKYTVLVTGTVQEEDCDGLCWQYIINEDKVKPEFVVITEPTDGNIYRGQRGRMEIRVEVKGVSCHGSAPERGDNAIYISLLSIREIQIKSQLGKVDLPLPIMDIFTRQNAEHNIQLLAIELTHMKALTILPNLHVDPFDRILVAQAIAEDMTMLTDDPNIRQYRVKVLW